MAARESASASAQAAAHRVRAGVGQGLQVGVVTAAIGQVHIQITRHLAEGKVLFAMHGEGEYARLIAEDGRRAIALMDIQIKHQNAAHQAFLQQQA